ncbi:hypothetical protein Aperf_G00000109263 [Anoplocephala perfoliata]
MADARGSIPDPKSDKKYSSEEASKDTNHLINMADENRNRTNVSSERTSGPLSKEEAERLQREANEETTNSEDLRLFLQEMRQHVQQQQQQQAQNQAFGSTSQMSGSTGAPHQFQHQISTRSHGVPQAINNPNAIAAPKRSVVVEPENVIDSCPDGGWGWIVVFASFVCMILVEGVCLSYGLLVAPICPGNSLHAVATSVRSANRSASGYATATSLGVVLSVSPRTVPIKPGSCVGVSEMGESLNTQSRMALMAPGGMLIGLSDSHVLEHFTTSAYSVVNVCFDRLGSSLHFTFPEWTKPTSTVANEGSHWLQSVTTEGPLASALSNQFDFRPIAMFGGVVATGGFFASAFSTNVGILCITLGLIGGIGFGLIYLPAIATVGHWFKLRRPFAVGVALCGSGVGSIITGQIFPLLIHEFTWKGALLVLAAFCAQCLVLIVLFRPLDLHFRIKYCQKLRQQAAKERERRLDARHQQERIERRRRAELNERASRAKAQAAAAARAQVAQARAAKKAQKAQKAQQRRVIYRQVIEAIA